MELNRDNLSEFFNIEHDKFIYCDNVQNPDEVIKNLMILIQVDLFLKMIKSTL